MMSRALCLLLLPGLAGAQVPAVPAGWPVFAQRFQSYVEADQGVGASVVYVRDGNIVAQHQVGFADRAGGQRVDQNTIFHWGSITKALTAIAIMQLRDQGRLSLDDRVTRFVPELRRVHDPYGMIDSITVRMLLNHTAGFQNPTWPYDKGLPWEPFEPTEWSQLVAMMPYERLLFRPGDRYSYSNPAFIYLGRILEQLSGDPWDAYIQKNIFAPLNLDRSYFRGTPYYLQRDRSKNYYVRKDSTGVERVIDNGPDFNPGITTPNGGWNAPLSDLARYVAFLTNRQPSGARPRAPYEMVLKRSSLEEMWKAGKPMGTNQWMGLSFFVLQRDGITLLGHTGSQAGYRSFFYFNPVTSAAVIAGFNTTNSSSPASAQFQALMDATYALLRS